MGLSLPSDARPRITSPPNGRSAARDETIFVEDALVLVDSQTRDGREQGRQLEQRTDAAGWRLRRKRLW